MVNASYFLIREMLSSNVDVELAISCEVFRSYSQLFQGSAGIL